MTARLLFAMLSGTAAGCICMRYASRLKAEAMRLSDWLALLERLRLSIGHGSSSLPDALETAADAHTAPDSLFRELASALRSNPASTLHAIYLRHDATVHPETAIVSRLMESLDHGSLESRILAIEQTQKAMRILYDVHADRSKRDAPMWTRIGWTAGACLMILLM